MAWHSMSEFRHRVTWPAGGMARDVDGPLVRSAGDAARRRSSAAVPRQGAHRRRAHHADVSQSSLVGP